DMNNTGGASDPGPGTVRFTGSGQMIGGANPTIFNNLIIDGGGTILKGAALKGSSAIAVAGHHIAAAMVDETVTGVLTLNGDLTVTSPTKLIMPASASSA